MDTADAIRSLGALAQETRLQAFRTLVQAGPAGCPAGTLADALGVPPTTLSFHLSQLANAGLVTARRDGRSILYAADFDRMNALIGFMTENCCGGTPSSAGLPLCAPAPAAANATSSPDEASASPCRPKT